MRRGKDWKWGNQDGGQGKLGTIFETNNDNKHWWRVRWDHGGCEFYRAGAEGCFDLEVAE